MAILTIDSTNKNLSWVIFKNKQTQDKNNLPFEKPLRKGVIYGWFINEQKFRLFFYQKSSDPSFYKNENNNYLNADKVLCPYVYCGIITNMLDSTIKKLQPKDILAFNKITLNTIYISNIYIANSFKKHLKSINIILEPLGGKLYSITFEGETTLFYLLNVIMVFCLIQSFEDHRIFIDLNEPTIMKYAQCLISMNAPYYLTYLFLSRCIPDYILFKKFAPLLTNENYKFYFGDTQLQRFNSIKKYLKNGNILHDIGCGELYYSFKLSQNYKKIISWDSDKEIFERNEKFILKKNITNITLKNTFSINNLKDIEPESDILITEMLEHIEKNEAKNLIEELSKINFSTLIITVPNISFNQNYLLETEFRHFDHKWEPTYQESIDFISSAFLNHNIKIEKICDMVNDESVSTLFIIRKK